MTAPPSPMKSDGILDLAVGGHEADMNASSAAETAVLYGDASGKFGATKTVITKSSLSLPIR